MKQLLIDSWKPAGDYNILTEDRSKLPAGVIMRVAGKSQVADVKNENSRIYRRGLWERTLSSPQIQEKLATRGMFGNLGHPSAEDEERPELVSHLVTEATLNPDGTIDCVYEVLDTPHGHIAATLFKAGRFGTSSRGRGSVTHESDASYVDDGYELETWDFVLNPSTPGAFPAVVEKKNKQNASRISTALRSIVEAKGTTPEVVAHVIDLALQTQDYALVEAGAARLREGIPNKEINFILSDPDETFYCETCKKNFKRPEGIPEGGMAKCPECGEEGKVVLHDEDEDPNTSEVENTMESQLQRRYDAAVKTLSESVKQLANTKKFHERGRASVNMLLQVLSEKRRVEAVQWAQKKVLPLVKEENRKLAWRILRVCESRKDVKRAMRTLIEAGAMKSKKAPAQKANPKRRKVTEGSTGWDVVLDGKVIDTVFYDDDVDADYVKQSLIDHDGYDPGIEVTSESKKRKPASKKEAAAPVRRKVLDEGKPPKRAKAKGPVVERKTRKNEGGGNRYDLPRTSDVDDALETLLFISQPDTSDNGSDESFLDAGYGYSDVDPQSKAGLQKDLEKFEAEAGDLLNDVDDWPYEFMLTACETGAGFGDGDYPDVEDALVELCNKYGPYDAYMGDDGVIYISGFEGPANESKRKGKKTSRRTITKRMSEAFKKSKKTRKDEQKKTAEPGTVSHGTMREEDLVPTFISFIDDLDPARAATLQKELDAIMSEHGEDAWYSEDMSYFLNETLWDAMQDYAPEGLYFGSHPGDGSDYGYWASEDDDYYESKTPRGRKPRSNESDNRGGKAPRRITKQHSDPLTALFIDRIRGQ